ncbi:MULTISPECIES: VOC family protein [unclassified Streptomyces]
MDGRVMSSKIVVSDLARSLAFYKGLFGFKEAARLEFCDPDVTEVVLEDVSGARCFVLLQGDVMPVPSVPGWAPLVVQIDDIQAARDEAERSGYELAIEPISFGPVSILMVADPDGYLVEVVSGDPDGLDAAPAGQKIPHPIPQIHDRK